MIEAARCTHEPYYIEWYERYEKSDDPKPERAAAEPFIQLEAHHFWEPIRYAGEDAEDRREQPDVDGVETVDVFVRRDRVEHLLVVDLRRQGQLHEDPVDGVVGIQRAEEREEVRLRRAGGEPVKAAAHADLVRGLLFVARVDLARGILADEHDVQPGHGAMRASESVDALPDLGADGLGQRVAVEDGRRHPQFPLPRNSLMLPTMASLSRISLVTTRSSLPKWSRRSLMNWPDP